MADNVEVSTEFASATASVVVSADEVSAGPPKVVVQRVKLALSADGSETHVQADADGLLVNLGANNDVTVTGTVTANPQISASANNVGAVVPVGAAESVQVLAANASRKALTLIPEGDVYMSLGGTASASNGRMPAYTPYNLTGVYSGAISMLSVTGTINVNVWEV